MYVKSVISYTKKRNWQRNAKIGATNIKAVAWKLQNSQLGY